jgi:putative heme-binding domain-containing protein
LPTEDGLHWNAEGYRGAAGVLARQLSFPPVMLDAARREVLRASIVDKNAMRFFQWRFQNWVYLAGPRRAEQGRLTAELPQFEKPVANLEDRIAAVLEGEEMPAVQVPPVTPDAEPLRPLPEFTVDGVEVQLFAETPLIGKPVQLTFDELGRMWVVCSSSYPQARPDELPDDRIYILDDTNHDGRADKSTLFADRLTIPCGVEPGDGGCYVAASTELLFLKDTNGDGRADERRVLLSGFGTEDSHHLIHGTRWGPDGRLYFNQSLFIRSSIETPHGMVRAERGNVWRFDPRNASLETISHGWINPWSKAVDRYGNYFTADNSGEGLHFTFRDSLHVTQIAPRLCPPVGPLNEPKLCGLEILRGPAWPDDWQGRVVAGSHTGHSIRQYAMRENGAGFAATALPDLLRTSDDAVRPVDLQLGPDGALYIADWTNPIINHGEVDFRDPRRDLTNGRIWRVSARNRPSVHWEPLSPKSTPELCAELLSPNPWSQYQARRLLKERGPEVLTDVKTWATGNGSDEAALETLWLHVALKVADDSVTAAAFTARNGRVRAAALRVVPSFPAALKLAKDEHPRVRLEAARVLGTFPSAESAAAVLGILNTPMDSYLDYALWLTIRELSQPWVAAVLQGQWSPNDHEAQLNFALAAIEPQQAGEALAYLLKGRVIPSDGTGPWLALIGKAGHVAEVQRLWTQFAAGGFDDDATHLVLAALEDAARRNLRVSCPPERLAPLFQHRIWPVRETALRLAGHWQLSSLGEVILTAASDPAAPESQRSAAFDSLRLMQGGNARSGLAKLTTSATPPAIRQRAIITLASFDASAATPALLQLLRDTAAPDATALWSQLFGSTSVTGILRDALADAEVPPAVCAEGLRLMDSLHLSDSALHSALRRKSAASEAEKKWTKSEFKELATAAIANGNIQRGKAIYERSTLACTACHAISGQGGKVGPDLANLGASAPLDYIVESILDPAAAVKEGFHATQVTTTAGEEFFAMLAGESDTDLLLRDSTGKEFRISKPNVTRRKPIGSLMPAALTDSLRQPELLDLIRYLSSLGRN